MLYFEPADVLKQPYRFQFDHKIKYFPRDFRFQNKLQTWFKLIKFSFKERSFLTDVNASSWSLRLFVKINKLWICCINTFCIFLQHWLSGHSNESIPREFKERNCKRKIPGEYCCFRQCTVSVTLLHKNILVSNSSKKKERRHVRWPIVANQKENRDNEKINNK